ncbi:MAG: twin-arginine translocation signal domain-containing protein [Candidatus Rokuibacteriota bacterium]
MERISRRSFFKGAGAAAATAVVAPECERPTQQVARQRPPYSFTAIPSSSCGF